MAVKIRIEHVSDGWAQIFLSAEMKALVDGAGERIAGEAGDGFEYGPAQNNRFTAAGFVSSTTHASAVSEAIDKTLTKAVHK